MLRTIRFLLAFHKAAIVGFLIALLLAGWVMSDGLARVLLSKPNGYIQSGSMFGVAIGESRLSAHQKLLNEGMKLTQSKFGGNCVSREVATDRQLDIFLTKSWHGGMVCVVSQNESVDEVIWQFQPMDF